MAPNPSPTPQQVRMLLRTDPAWVWWHDEARRPLARSVRDLSLVVRLCMTVGVLIVPLVQGTQSVSVALFLVLATVTGAIRRPLLPILFTFLAAGAAVGQSVTDPSMKDLTVWVVGLFAFTVGSIVVRRYAMLVLGVGSVVLIAFGWSRGMGEAQLKDLVLTVAYPSFLTLVAVALLSGLLAAGSSTDALSRAREIHVDTTMRTVRTRQDLDLRRLLHNEVLPALRECRSAAASGDMETAATAAGRVRTEIRSSFDELVGSLAGAAPLIEVLAVMDRPDGLRVDIDPGEGQPATTSGPVIIGIRNALEELARNAVRHTPATRLVVRLTSPTRLEAWAEDSGGSTTLMQGGPRPNSGLDIARRNLATLHCRLTLPAAGEPAVFSITLPTRPERLAGSIPVSLRSPLGTAARIMVGFQTLYGAALSLGDEWMVAELLLIAILAVFNLVVARRLSSDGELSRAAVIGLGTVVCGATVAGLWLSGPGATADAQSWVIASAGISVACYAMCRRIVPLVALCAAHLAAVVVGAAVTGPVDWRHSIGALTATFLTPILFYLVSSRVAQAESGVTHNAELLRATQEEALAIATAFISRTEAAELLDNELDPFFARVAEGHLTPEELSEAAAALESLSYIELAYPSISDAWVRGQVMDALARGVAVKAAETGERPQRERRMALRLLGLALECAPDGARVTMTEDGAGHPRVAIVPPPEPLRSATVLTGLPNRVRIGVTSSDHRAVMTISSLDPLVGATAAHEPSGGDDPIEGERAP